MAKSTPERKTIVSHPRTKIKRKFDTAIYDPIRAAIEQVLKNSEGKTWTDLSEEVNALIKKKLPGFKGSVPWYTISIKNDLEAQGIIETFIEKGVKYNRIKKRAV
jgi:hypothetical protein